MKRPIITYIVSYEGTGLVKIGQARYYGDRMMQLRNGSPIHPTPVCAFLGAYHERELHALFAHLRKRLEYFEDSADLRAHLAIREGRITHEEALALSPVLTRIKKTNARPVES